MAFQKTFFIICGMLCSAQANSADRFEELYCLAKNIYFESRNQPWVGQVAVAQVTLNRVRDSRFPNTICKVVKQKRNRKTCQQQSLAPNRANQKLLRRFFERPSSISQVFSLFSTGIISTIWK